MHWIGILAVGIGAPQSVSDTVASTGQMLRPVGRVTAIAARPVDIAVTPQAIFVKDNQGICALDPATGKEFSRMASPGGASLTGMEVDEQGGVWMTNAALGMHRFVLREGKLALDRSIGLPGTGEPTGNSFPCGLALLPNNRAVVCLSRSNQVVLVDLAKSQIIARMDAGVAPYDVVASKDGRRAFVTFQGGRKPESGDKTATSAGTATVVDERGIARTGLAAEFDLETGKVLRRWDVGLQPSGLLLNEDLNQLIIANANSDTLSFIDLENKRPTTSLVVTPDSRLPFGSMPNALAREGKWLYAACAGLNSTAVIDLSNRRIRGWIPTGWLPGSLVMSPQGLVIANTKGFGSRAVKREKEKGWNSHDYLGSIQIVANPLSAELPAWSKQALEAARVAPAVNAMERSNGKAPKRAWPEKNGDASKIEHMVYIIKENRTYDQFFGDMKEGRGDKRLNVFGEKVVPNHRALAREFVLLDNYYCNGVLSADGHSWATEGNVTPYLEKAFGGFNRSYTFGDDPITYSSSGFIWDAFLGAGKSFRNYGEMDYAEPPAGWKVQSIWRNYAAGQTARFNQKIGVDRLRRYSSRTYPGWNMGIPDVLRADRFLAEFREYERTGGFPNLTIVYLPQDHGAGTNPGYPTPASYMADNDLALGKVVEAISRSRYWGKTAIFVNEDDPQGGFDHVDGHRSICLVISPYSRKKGTVSQFYNQSSVLKTMLHLSGLPPMNQQVAAANLMKECFGEKADLAPYRLRNPETDINAVNPPLESLTGLEKELAIRSMNLPLSRPGLKSEDDDLALNRIIWHAMKGFDVPFPIEFTGRHGRGLAERGLKIER